VSLDLSQRCILITGASSGIGEATARACARQGARVVLVSERESELNAVAESICEAGGKAVPLVVDLSHPEQVEGLIARIEAEVGPLDTLVNNAGVGLQASVLETRSTDMRFLFEVNFFALAELCRQAIAVMIPRRKGRIINVSSAAGRFGSPNISAYSATKGAVHAFTQSLRLEARVHGVFVSEVLPISVRTGFFDNVKTGKYQPQGLVLTPEGVAQDIVRCIAAPRPRPEILPFRGIRLVFVLNALLPGLLVRLAGRRYAHAVLQKPKLP
jgi:short-subunit dehydrogenase